jgi:hypothetical protein
MISNKNSTNLKGISPRAKENNKFASIETKIREGGLSNNLQIEAVPNYIKSSSETVFGGNNVNAFIVIGKDRPASLSSGHGGLGDTQCATIDLVAGRISALPMKYDDNTGEKIYVDSNFKMDAARIYISQMTDVDDNFSLANGNIGNSKNKSAIAIKADGIRIIGREGIKLVTKTDSLLSSGEKQYSNVGVEIIANNDDTQLQPMVLGNNLTECLKELVNEVDKLQNRMALFIDAQTTFNQQVSEHTHITPFFAKPTLKSAQLVGANIIYKTNKLFKVDFTYYLQKVNFAGIITKYLSAQSGESSIRSKYNKVN